MSKKNKIKTSLLLFTSDYPYGTREPYIVTELQILKNHFSEIIIISNNTTSKTKQPVVKNIDVFRNSFELNFFEKLISLRYLFFKSFFNFDSI